MWNDDDGSWSGMHDGGAWVGMGLVMLLATALVVGLLVWIALLLRDARPTHTTSPAPATHPHHPSPADEHLASRFASGEIDADEFERRVEVLRRSRRDLLERR